MKVLITLLIALLAGVVILPTGCRPAEATVRAPETTVPATEPAATEPATMASVTMAAPTITAETAAPSTPETVADDSGPTPRSPVFPIPPFDRSVYAGGLIEENQGVLAALSGAPVYHMAIAIDESLTRIDGRQTVYFTNQEDVDLDEVYFHLHPNLLEGTMVVGDVFVDGMPVEAEPVESGTALRVPLGKTLSPGKHAAIDMTFETIVPTDIGRNYGVLAYYSDTLALAHFYPMLSVYDQSGWNITPADVQGDITYSDTAFYLVEVTAPPAVTLVAAGQEIAREASDAGRKTRFAAGPARDFFLSASPDYQVVSRTIGETTINSYAPAALQDGAELALTVAADALAIFSRQLGKYPYTELDIVTTPTSALGIEYPGIIVGTVNMYDVAATTGSGVPMAALLESTTAHEVAHQWFYNLVGNDQLDEPWLDEGLVTYLTYRYFLDRYGEPTGESYFDTLEGRWQRVERAEIPIGLPVAAYEGREYGAIVYGRGAIFMRALEEALGRDTFDAFLSDYTEQFKWAIATGTDFRDLAEARCDCDLGSLWADWVEQ